MNLPYITNQIVYSVLYTIIKYMKELNQNFINIIKFSGFFGSNGLGSQVNGDF